MVEKKRVVYFDVLNILATFLVVWIHFGNEIHWYENSMRWNQACVIQAIAFCAVPIFFMLTGATLLNYRDRYNTKQYFYNRFMRIFIPYLIWGAVFCIWRLSRGEISLCFDSWWQLIYSIINMYINNTMEPIFWFFAPLFAIYFAIPALTPLSKTENKHVLQYMVWGGVITITILPFAYNLCALMTGSHFYWNGSWQISALGGYLLYAVTGFYLANYELEKKKRYLIYGIGILCMILRLTGMFYFFSLNGEKPAVFFDYLSCLSYFWAVAVFVFFKYLNYSWLEKNSGIRMLLKKLASCSFGVYLMHILVLTFMQEKLLLWGNATLWHFVWPIVCYLFCVCVVMIVKKIPILNKIFP